MKESEVKVQTQPVDNSVVVATPSLEPLKEQQESTKPVKSQKARKKNAAKKKAKQENENHEKPASSDNAEGNHKDISKEPKKHKKVNKSKSNGEKLDADSVNTEEPKVLEKAEKKPTASSTETTAATQLPTTEMDTRQEPEQSSAVAATDNGTSAKKRNKRAKKKQQKKKEAPTSEEHASKEKTYVVDYKGLHDALKESFSLDERLGPVHFAPLIGKSKKTFDSFSPKTSYSTSPARDHPIHDHDSSSRLANRSTPTAKNRHAEVPPPPSLIGVTKKKTPKKVADMDTPTNKPKAEKTKSKKSKGQSKIIVMDELENSPQQLSKEISQQPGTLANEKEIVLTNGEKSDKKKKKKKKTQDVTAASEPVEPATVKKDATKKKTRKIADSTKVKQEPEAKQPLQREADQQGDVHSSYCHPNDAIHPKRHGRLRFERYLDPKICEQKIEQGQLYKGVLRINKRSRSDAYVTCENLDGDIFINGQRDRNRAFEGDTVVVELTDLEASWAKKKQSMIQKREERHKTALERPPRDEGEDDKGKPKYVGKVVAITSTSKATTCVGILSIHRNAPTTQQSEQDENTTPEVDEENGTATEPDGQKQVKLVWFKPTDLRKPLVAIPIRHAPADFLENEKKYRNLLVVVKINRWPIDSMHPFGTVLRELGHIGNIVAETQAILEDNHVVEQPFGQKALNSLPKVPWSISQDEIDKRRDLRDYRIFTIDPATAKDLDDAVHVIKLGEDEFEVGVHIADVSHFVHQHTALDHEAFDRGTSTYLCDRVIPMLPSLLCEQLCSLNPSVERLSFSVIWKMDGAGHIKDTWFGKSVIKSCAKLAYEDAQSVIEGKGLPSTATVKSFAVSEVEQDIKYLYGISKQMRERRFSSGALSINSIRLSFKLNEIGEPCAVSIYEQKDANRLIEEFMLCANMSVAQKIAHHYPDEALLRQHAPPHEKTLNEFIKIAENMGYQFDGSSAGSMQQSFNAIESEDVRAVLRLLAVKPMQRARYFCTGSCDISKYGHYALNVPLYTHFTSPIRRFADIVVHRQLEAALKNKPTCGYKKDAVVKAATQCNERKEGAKNSQDMNIQLYLAHYLHMIETQTQKPVVCTAIVTQVLKDCFEVLVSEYGIEKRIHMDALPIQKYVYDPRKHALSVYWKEGVEATREYDMNRKLDEDYREPSGTQLYLGEDSSDSNDEATATKSVYTIPDELLSDELIDATAKSQRFETFSKLQVRIQVNVERSPPIVNIYPINPFL